MILNRFLNETFSLFYPHHYSNNEVIIKQKAIVKAIKTIKKVYKLQVHEGIKTRFNET